MFELLIQEELKKMNRGGSAGGGQSSLGYLFGSGEAPKAAPKITQNPPTDVDAAGNNAPLTKPASSPPADGAKQIPAGIHGNPANNYHRSEGQNTGNFITDRPSTKVHAAPGGGSSLDYLFGGGGK